jgi:hypothetical protein
MPTNLTGNPTYHDPIPAPVDGEPVTGASVQQTGQALIDNDAWFKSILLGAGLEPLAKDSQWSSIIVPTNPDLGDTPYQAFSGVVRLASRTDLISDRTPGYSDSAISFEVPITQALIGNTGWNYSFTPNAELYWIQTTYASQANILIPIHILPREGVITKVDAIIEGDGWSTEPDNMPEIHLIRTSSLGTNVVVFSGTDGTIAFNSTHTISTSGSAHSIVLNSTYYILVKGCSPAELDATLRLHRARVYVRRA